MRSVPDLKKDFAHIARTANNAEMEFPSAVTHVQWVYSQNVSLRKRAGGRERWGIPLPTGDGV